MHSKALNTYDSIAKGLYFVSCFGTGTTFACFHIKGNSEVVRIVLYKWVKYHVMWLDIKWRNVGCISSQPIVFDLMLMWHFLTEN